MRSWSDYLEYFPSSKEQFRELPKISVVGCFQNGKSTFINCLLNELVARPGDGRATTRISTRYRWGKSNTVKLRTNLNELQAISLKDYIQSNNLSSISKNSTFQAEITLDKPILKKIELIDTPGFEAFEQDTENATRSLEATDYAIVVLTNKLTLGESELAMFECINSKQIPYAVIMNCRNNNIPMEWYPNLQKNLEIIKTNEATLEKWGHFPEKIGGRLVYPCNLLWYWLALNINKYLNSDSDNEEDDVLDKIESTLKRKKEDFSKENLIKLSNFSTIESFFQDRLACIT